jgi:hypothetical protein
VSSACALAVTCVAADEANTSKHVPLRFVNRRRFVLAAAGAGAAAWLRPAPSSAVSTEQIGPTVPPERVWTDRELCAACGGYGEQACMLCGGTGTLVMEDDISAFGTTCPNCGGQAKLPCPKCLGLGLADTRGILRDGMLRWAGCGLASRYVQGAEMAAC